MIAFWYQTQPMCIKWGTFNSTYFKVSNGVRQGGVLLPNSLLYIYIDDLSQGLATIGYEPAGLTVHPPPPE